MSIVTGYVVADSDLRCEASDIANVLSDVFNDTSCDMVLYA